MSEPKVYVSARERAKVIAALTANGLTSREVAKQMGISHVRVCHIADRYSVPLSRPGSRRFGLYIADRRAKMIRDLSAEAKISPATMIERIIRVVLDDGEEQARKRLGKFMIQAVTYSKAARP